MKILKVLAALSLLIGVAHSQDTYFSYDFEFGEVGEFGFDLLEIAELNDEGEIVGEWSGDDFPFPDPSGYFAGAETSGGIVENPFGGTMLFIDRPTAPAQHVMNLTEPVLLPGATFSVTVGTRRTGGGYPREPKSYDFFGLDSNGNESFRIRVLADGSRERLGYVVNGEQFDDFATVEGEDMADDIQNIGGVPFTDTDDIVDLNVVLGGSGYTVSYENRNGTNSWRSATIPFNGTEAQDLAQVVLSYGGVEGVNNDQVGFVVDDASVTGFLELLQGDFDLDDDIDMADFQTLASNFGKNTSAGDFDFSGTVDMADWIGFKAAYNAFNAAGAAAVPEPSSASLAILAMVFAGNMLRRKRGM